MDQGTSQILFSILRSAICGTSLDSQEKEMACLGLDQSLVDLANEHDLSHLLYVGLKQNSLLRSDTIPKDIEKAFFKAIYRYEHLNYEFNAICEEFEKAEIEFIPLKGTVLRRYYPEPWMRTSCDIDILVHEEDTQRAMNLMMSSLKYSCEGEGSHDISLFSPSGVHLELHFTLNEPIEKRYELLDNIWSYADKCEGKQFMLCMSDEAFYFYHMAHMAKHFAIGGCGIRPFIDLWILNHRTDDNREKRVELLEEGGLLSFARQAELLSDIWFGKETHTELTKMLENYLLKGGVYGNTENRVAVQQSKRGGKLRYAFSRVFLPYNTIKYHYPVLQKHKWLLPFMQIRRWMKLIFKGGLKRSVNELRLNSSLDEYSAIATQEMIRQLGL